MKILKIFGVVVGIHVFALMLIFANPGCSSTSKTIPAPTDTLPPSGMGPTVSVPMSTNTVSVPGAGANMAPPTFNPDAPAMAASTGVRFTPTRPNTPAAATLISEPVLDVTPATTYTVAAGDNLWSLSKKYNVSTAQLATANSLKTNAVLHPGQKLIIPGKPASATAAATADPAASAPRTAETIAPRAPNETVKHVVKPGETLSLIAQQYGVRQGDIAVANNIADPQRIRAGMELTIPGWQSTTKSGKAAAKATTKAPAGKAGEQRNPNVEAEPAATRPPPPEIPVIRVDDNPAITPAPRAP